MSDEKSVSLSAKSGGFSPRFGSTLTAKEEVQIFSAIARDQVQSGNYEAGMLALKQWWRFGEWPNLEHLETALCADLLFTAGLVAVNIASTGQIRVGQKHAQSLLNGSIAFFEQLGNRTRAAEVRIELARSYYREGLFDLALATIDNALKGLLENEFELKGLALVLQASIERDSGRSGDSLSRLTTSFTGLEPLSPLVKGRYHHELATTLKERAQARDAYSEDALVHFRRALEEFEAIGNHRHVAASENNFAFLLIDLRLFEESKYHLLRAQRFFEIINDKVRRAQVNDTLAKLYIEMSDLKLAESFSSEAVRVLSQTDEDALLAEALTTLGIVLCRDGRINEGKKSFDAANNIANLCGDREGAGRALLLMCEEMGAHLDEPERVQIGREMKLLLGATQQASIQARLSRVLATLSLE